MTTSAGTPIGATLIQKCLKLERNRRVFYQALTLVLTFIAYTSFHMSRRPLAVVKNSLNRDCSRVTPPVGLVITDENRHNWCDWKPFDGSDANRLLGILDSAYLFAYAACMFLSGMLAERIDLRYYLSLGMIFSGIFTYLFGLAYYLDIHSFAFFFIVQLLGGAVQCTGWPGVVACVGNWFGKARRGLIFGIWNAHLYTGNMLGAYVAGYFVIENWGLSFIVPAALIGVVGFILFLFLVPHPEDVGCEEAVHHITPTPEDSVEKGFQFSDGSKPTMLKGIATVSPHKLSNEETCLTAKTVFDSNSTTSSQGRKEAITFIDAVKIPGVLEFSFCLFFSKLVSYTFLYWLPRYLDHSTGLGSQQSAYFSIPFDVGGIIGGVLAGFISDHSGSSATTCMGFLGLGTPMLFIYQHFGSSCFAANVTLQIICGALVNGPYALITTAVSAELGTHPSIKKNSKALSTVTAIIDGTGSIGAAVGPLLAGMVSELSWTYVFYMMMAADFFALLTLVRPAAKEMKKLCIENGWCFLRPVFDCTACCRREGELYQTI